MEEKVIGCKANNRKSSLALRIMLLLIASVLGVLFNDIKGYLLSIICVIALIAHAVKLHYYYNSPDVLITILNNDLKVYSDGKYTVIPLDSIINIELKNYRSKYVIHPYGNIIIYTEREVHVVRDLDNISDVKADILIIKNKNERDTTKR